MKWDETQLAILREFANLGAEAVAEIIAKRTGAARTAAAVQRKASRLGVSLSKYEVCPGCGVRMIRLDAKTGLCPTCKIKLQTDRQARFNAQLDEEVRQIKSGKEYRDASKKYASERQRTSRLCRKYGLPNMRQRQKGGDGDYVE